MNIAAMHSKVQFTTAILEWLENYENTTVIRFATKKERFHFLITVNK